MGMGLFSPVGCRACEHFQRTLRGRDQPVMSPYVMSTKFVIFSPTAGILPMMFIDMRRKSLLLHSLPANV